MSKLKSIEPVIPPAPYVGGKRLLAARIIERINSTPPDVFVGMGGMFFRRKPRRRKTRSSPTPGPQVPAPKKKLTNSAKKHTSLGTGPVARKAVEI